MEDVDEALNYESSDFMSSEFFDSVLSLENNMDESFLSNFEDDINLSSDDMNIFSDASSHIEEVLSPQSLNSESDKNSSSVDSLDETIIGNVDVDVDVLEPLDDPFILSLFKPSNFECKEEPADSKPILFDKNISSIQQTRILIQNPNNKKIIAKPLLTTASHPHKQISVKGKPHILKVQPLNSNGNPVLLPLNMKSIKILNTPANIAALSNNLKRRKIDVTNNKVSSNPYPPLMLTQEEKRLLAKEGIQLPTHHPLTKNEERELKRIRRKIRNKISAQDSRKRKKEYVDGLEDRVKRGSEENKNLLQRVRALQKQNKTLIAHVNKLQALIRNSTNSKATPSTCLMVVLLSALLVSIPNIKMFGNKQISTEQEQVAIRRSLLSSQQATTEDNNNLSLDEFLIFNDDKGKIDEEMFDIDNSTEKEFNRMMEDMEKEYENILSNNNKSKMGIFGKVFETFKYLVTKEKPELFGSVDYGGYNSKNTFIEPDIDEYITDEGPPLKRSKFIIDENPNSLKNNDQVIVNTVNSHIPSKTK